MSEQAATKRGRGRPGKLGDVPAGATRHTMWMSAPERAAVDGLLRKLRAPKTGAKTLEKQG